MWAWSLTELSLVYALQSIILFGRDLLPLITAQTAIGANLVFELQESVKQLQALVATQAVTMQQALAVQRAPPTFPIEQKARTAAGGGARRATH